MVKRCCYGTCNTDSRYKERLIEGLNFIPFPKPARNFEKCRRWIRLCGRPHEQLNENKLRDPMKSKHFYVCTKHFVDGKPTAENPDPLPAIAVDIVTPARRPPKIRSLSEPPKKKRRIYLDEAMGDGNTDGEPSQVEKENNRNIDNVMNMPGSLDTLDETSVSTQVTTVDRSLDLLALAAENEALKRQAARLLIENEELLRHRTVQCHKGKKSAVPRIMSASSLRDNKKRDEFIYYTGLTSEQFKTFYTFLMCSNENELPFEMIRTVTSQKNMCTEDQVLLVMMKLRQNFDFLHIGKLYGISQQDASTIFRNWLQYMFFRCSSVSMWPHRDIIMKMMPDKFREEFPTTMVIIDGTELKIQKPSSMTRQSQCYSDYKSANTLKGLVGIEPRGGFVFASMLFSGGMSDKKITTESGFLKTLKTLKENGMLIEGDGIMVDKGFKIHDEVEELGFKLNIPPFKCSGSQMSSSDIKLTEKIARHRVHVERAIARIKSYKILSHRIDLSLFSCVDQIWFVCCFVTNFMNFLIK